MLALALMLSCGAGKATSPSQLDRTHQQGSSGYVVTKDYGPFPYTGNRLPQVTNDSEAVGECHVVVDGSKANGCDTRCISADGGSLGTVTDPHTALCVDTMLQYPDAGWVKGYDITDPTQAPDLVSTGWDTVYGQHAATTVIIAMLRKRAVSNVSYLLYGWDG